MQLDGIGPDFARQIEIAIERGARFALWDEVHHEGRRSSGRTTFRDQPIVLEVPDTDDVLFPTDLGMSGMIALERATTNFADCRALDIGCGAGNYAVAMLMAGARSVTGIDVNPNCGPITSLNLIRNGLDPDRFTFHGVALSDFEPDVSFDVVISNPPHFPYDPALDFGRGIDRAALGGTAGRSLHDAILDRLPRLLAAEGTVFLVHSSLANIPRTLARLSEDGYDVSSVLRVELDLNLFLYRDQLEILEPHLEQLRARKEADFSDGRYYVEVLEARRAR